VRGLAPDHDTGDKDEALRFSISGMTLACASLALRRAREDGCQHTVVPRMKCGASRNSRKFATLRRLTI
jgi:hypothetical protein